MRRTAAGFEPASQADALDLETLPIGAEVRAELRRPRSVRHHRKMFAMLQTVAKGCGRPVDELLDIVKLETGRFRVIERKGQRWKIPSSIAFDKMDQGDFNEFFDEAVAIVAAETGLKQPDLYHQLRAAHPDLFGR